MLDGRIDIQGTIKELRAQGVLEEITVDAKAEIREAEMVKEEVVMAEGEEPKPPIEVAAKAPRKLVEDEKRETGGVKWPVYNSYLKASYVKLSALSTFTDRFIARICCGLSFFSSFSLSKSYPLGTESG